MQVRGLFPYAGLMQFTSSELVEAGAHDDRIPGRVIDYAVDVARFGDDVAIIRCRQGCDDRHTPAIKLRLAETMERAAQIADESTPEPGLCDPYR